MHTALSPNPTSELCGYLDHVPVMLIPVYRVPSLFRIRQKAGCWAPSLLFMAVFCTLTGALGRLQPLWHIGPHFLHFLHCSVLMTASKTITTKLKQKLWMTAQVHGVLRTWAFWSGNKAAYRTARAKLQKSMHILRKSTAPFRTLVTHGTCGRASGPSITTGPVHLPVRPPIQMHCMVLHTA